MVAATAAPAAASTWTSVPSQWQLPTKACTQVLFIGVRGSGESATEHGGYGRIVERIRDGVRLPSEGKTTVTEVALEYPALPIGSWSGPSLVSAVLDIGNNFLTFDMTSRPGYMESVQTGADNLIETLDDQYVRCPDQQVVLAGYSQGAWVIHLALARRGNHATSQISGVALIADPGRNPLEGVAGTKVGNPSRGFGVGPAMSRVVTTTTGMSHLSILPSGSGLHLPTRVWGRTIDVCLAGDPVCDAYTHQIGQGSSLETKIEFGILAARLGTLGVHTSYGQSTDFDPGNLLKIGYDLNDLIRPTVAPPVEPIRFTDVAPTDQFYNEITWMRTRGLTTGYADGSYRPLEPVRRDAMAAFLYRLAGSPPFTPPTQSPFTDVTPTTQFYREIAWLAEARISTGWPAGGGRAEFRPLSLVNRDAMAAFLYRFSGSPLVAPGIDDFVDVPPGTQFYNEITWMSLTELSTGWTTADGRRVFQPTSPIARDAMAAFLFRYDHNFG
ncbi:hypothetical protein C8046_16695 [Serinibacter arcticus]|uniref:SLH domain-containing protein n=2 Tax=Serinibacter arcticus TaxID=1655435 RepID=A0A2U1ZYG7_9MICO|nr:hypothetical protein C8046_16695 [Serinibacter arcticus]